MESVKPLQNKSLFFSHKCFSDYPSWSMKLMFEWKNEKDKKTKETHSKTFFLQQQGFTSKDIIKRTKVQESCWTEISQLPRSFILSPHFLATIKYIYLVYFNFGISNSKQFHELTNNRKIDEKFTTWLDGKDKWSRRKDESRFVLLHGFISNYL